MRATRRRALMLSCVAIAVLALGAVAYAHLPKYVLVSTEAGRVQVRSFGSTVGDALTDGRIPVARGDRVLPAADTPLVSQMTIRIRRAFPVRLFADGHARVLLTAAATVAEFLENSGVRLRARDHTYPAQDAAIWPGATVRVVRIETRVTGVEERLPYARIATPDPTLPRGQTRVVQSGRPGVRIHRIAVTTADGLVVDRQKVDAVVTRPPQDRITRVGTRRVLASRGDFAGKEILHMEATGYAPWHGQGVDDITATGMKAGYGVVAVDPKVIPLGSVLYIEGYGRAIAGDTGGAIKGNRIDLGFGTAREAYQFGRRPVRVYILSMPPART